VVDHVLFVVGDLAASRRLYTAALAPVGYEELHVQENGVHYGVEGLDDFAIYQGAPVTTAAHVAFVTEDRASVDAFFEAALANGATPRGEPGVWTSTRSGITRRSSTTSTATTSRRYGMRPSR
jgi:catechol 2,3-dioxygenase-like lactoylglutathione lyase family enzyme